jgi:anti-repressor protein
MDNLTIVENGLIPIYKGESGQVVDARELHEFLESKQEFTNWIKGRVEKYGFIENEDFTIILSKSTGGRPSTEYTLTIDTAKEIAMVENNEQGHIIRKYFIEVEKRARQPKQMSQAEILAGLAQVTVEIERKANTAIEVANKASRQITNALDIFTAPIDKDWRQAMNSKMRGICQEYELSYLTFYHDLYEELENLARIDLKARLARLRTRLQAQGATKTACKAITKLEVIERDPKLKPIFEGIVRKYQAKYAVA